MNFQVEINEETLQDIINIETGVFAPLTGFMGADEIESVIDRGILMDGSVFPIPVTLDVPQIVYDEVHDGETVKLLFQGKAVAELDVKSHFYMTKSMVAAVFGTSDETHPGVKKEMLKEMGRLGGKTRLLKRELLVTALKPDDTKAVFKERGWKTIVGFQTRNPIHKAHEYIQRLGLEICDGLFINPLTGWKKKRDFSREAVMAAYKVMTEEFYPEDRIYLAELKTQMRYAGPREAIFHAIMRRNLGCTHFIIGRDHAGVGNFYGAYDAHLYAKEMRKKYDLGIELLLTREPYYCEKCGQIVTDRTCTHYNTYRKEISGTLIRKYIKDGKIPDEIIIRKEIFEAILSCGQVFVE